MSLFLLFRNVPDLKQHDFVKILSLGVTIRPGGNVLTKKVKKCFPSRNIVCMLCPNFRQINVNAKIVKLLYLMTPIITFSYLTLI